MVINYRPTTDALAIGVYGYRNAVAPSNTVIYRQRHLASVCVNARQSKADFYVCLYRTQKQTNGSCERAAAGLQLKDRKSNDSKALCVCV